MDPAPYQVETSVDPLTGQTIVAVTAFGANSTQYRGTFVSAAPVASSASAEVLAEIGNIAPIVQAAAASPSIAPGDLAANMLPVPTGDMSAAQDALNAIAVQDAAVPSATNA